MKTRDRNMLVGMVAVLIAGAFWMLALSPRRTEADALASQVVAAQQQRDDAVAQAAIAKNAKQNYKADYAVVAKLGKAVPAEDDMASLLYQLQDAAGRSQVEMRAIAPEGANGAPVGNAADPAAGAGPAGTKAVKLSLSFAGTYPALQRFVRRVHGFTSLSDDRISVSGRLLSIDGIKLAVEPLSNRLTAEVTATAYVVAPEVAAVAPAAADPGTAGAVPTTASAPVPPVTPATVVAGG